MITSQDLQKILKALSKLSKTTEQLQKADYVKDTDTIAILQNGKDKKATIGDLADALAGIINAYNIPISIEHVDANNLKEALDKLYAMIASIDPNINQSSLYYSYTGTNVSFNTIKDALDWLLNTMLGEQPHPTIATDSQIDTMIINETSTI